MDVNAPTALFEAHEVCDYLLSRGLIRAGDVHAGATLLPQGTSRHSTFVYQARRGHRLFVKCARSETSGARGTVGKEKQFYRLVAQGALSGALSRHVPRVLACEHDSKFLVLEFVPTVPARQLRGGLGGRLRSAAAFLADTHGGTQTQALVDLVKRRLGVSRPWVLDLLEHASEWSRQADSGLAHVVHGVRSRPLLVGLIEDLQAAWVPHALVHGDLRDANVLLAEPLRFVDWEFAGYGDPAWDLACLLSWLDVELDQVVGGEQRYEWSRAILDAYAPGRRLGEDFCRRVRLLRAARLIERASEGPDGYEGMARRVDLLLDRAVALLGAGS